MLLGSLVMAYSLVRLRRPIRNAPVHLRVNHVTWTSAASVQNRLRGYRLTIVRDETDFQPLIKGIGNSLEHAQRMPFVIRIFKL